MCFENCNAYVMLIDCHQLILYGFLISNLPYLVTKSIICWVVPYVGYTTLDGLSSLQILLLKVN